MSRSPVQVATAATETATSLGERGSEQRGHSHSPGSSPTAAPTESNGRTDPQPENREPSLNRGAMVGRYVILGQLGRGAMGVVYAAYDPQLDRRVALKLLRVRRSKRHRVAEARERLQREAQALAQLSHPNVVAVHDVGTIDDDVFMAMELVEGQTLRAWLRDQPRTPAAVVAIMVAAGRGLAAAHAAGLVHRDFKPDNVVIGADGRVRVVDFGLARASETQTGSELDSRPESRPGTDPQTGFGTGSRRLQSALTLEGAIIGTPGYMPPEQYSGEAATELSDQFSYGVSLYEALHGQRPFTGDSIDEIARNTSESVIAKPEARVPLRLRRVAMRAMSSMPEDRYANMDALLEELARDPWRGRRMALTAAAATLAVAAAGGVTWRTAGARANPCPSAEPRLAGIWDHATQSKIRNAFTASASPLADASWNGVSRQLSHYAHVWLTRHRDVCQATLVRGEQSGEAMDTRMSCLTERLDEFRAVADVLAHADSEVVRRAVVSASSLAPLTTCDDLAELRQRVPMPDSPSAREQIAALQSELHTIHAKTKAGKAAEVIDRLAAVAQEAHELGHAPLEAEAWLRLAEARRVVGDYSKAQAAVDEAVVAAEASGRDRVSAQALTIGVEIAVALEQFEQATSLTRRAGAEVAWLREPPELSGELELAKGEQATRQGYFATSIGHLERAVRDLSQAYGTSHVIPAKAHQLLGQSLFRLGEMERAEQEIHLALATFESTVGPRHPLTGQAHGILGNLEMARGRLILSERHIRQALAIYEAMFGPEHPQVAAALVNLGVSVRDQKRYDEARPLFERALKIFEATYGPRHSGVATVLVNLADSAVAQERYDEARALYQRALEIDRASLGDSHPYLAYGLKGLAAVEARAGNPREAVRLLERALAVWSAGEASVAGTLRQQLADVLWDAQIDRDRARKLMIEARALFRSRLPDTAKNLVDAEAWLDTH